MRLLRFSLKPVLMAIFISIMPNLSSAEKSHETDLAATSSIKAELDKIKKRYKHIDPVTGLRTSYYQAALPKSVPGGIRLNVQEVFTHYKNKTALFVDVMAHTGTGPDPLDGIWRIAKPRENIPGSIWLADVGTGTLSPEMMNYYKSNLEKLTKGDKTKKIIIYCTADCWMAWNAVRRAHSWGYSNLLWFPEGTDEWKEAGYPLKNATPIPLAISD